MSSSILKYLLGILFFTIFFYPSSSQAATESIRIIRQDCTGYTNCYTSLSSWEAAENRDLTVSDEIAVARIEGTWTSPDTTAVTIDGWTTDATRYIKIYTTSEARHSGVWSDAKYRLETSNNYRPILNYANHIRFDGLQIGNNTQTNYGVGMLFRPNGGSGNTDIQISNNIIRSTVSPNYNVTGLDLSYGAAYKIWNNMLYDFSNSSARGIFIWNNVANGLSTTYLYNNTIYNSYTGMSVGSGTTIAKNNIVQGSSYGYSGTFDSSSSNNISNIASDAPGSNSKNSTTVSFTDSANSNFHLASSDTAAKDSGIDLSSDPNLSFSTDIDGETRSGSWDIGADEVLGVISPTYQCSDSIDNDSDGLTDYPNDPGCSSTTDNDETNAVSDTTPPARSNGSPSGSLASSTTSTTISLSTNETATCKYGTTPNVTYNSILNTFSSTSSTSHSQTISGLQNGQSYTYYIRCQDSANNQNSDDYVISFGVAAEVQSSSNIYYVSPLGAALWSQCTDINMPCSWQVAMANARAGDIVYFRDGTYEPGVGNQYSEPVIHPANDGTVDAPITFKAYSGETAIIHDASWNTVAPSNNTKPALGCYQNSYIVWDGFTFVRNLDNGYQASAIVRFELSDHCTLKNSELIGRSHFDYANGALIHIVQSFYIYIYNNKLHGMSRDPNAIEATVNTTAIWSFDFDHVYIYNNDFYDNYGNINTKIGTSQLYIYNNHFWNCGSSAVKVIPQVSGTTDISIYQNIIRNCPTVLSSPDPAALLYNLNFYNNTIYNSGTGTLAEVGTPSYQYHRNTEIFNNIISNQGSNSIWGGYHNTLNSGAGFPTYMNYNNFHGTGRWRVNYVDYSALSAWQTASGADPNSITSNPLFVNPGGTNPEDYKLQSSSPARIGRGGSYASVMGAYITGSEVIGSSLTVLQPQDTTPPSIPSNLSATPISSSQINLSWTASTDNTAVTGYRIYRSGTQIGTSSTTTYSNTGLTPSTLYTYTVAAVDGSGNISSQSSQASATTQAPPDTTAPTISNISSTTTTSSSTITFVTSEQSDTQIEYGLTTAYGQTTTLNTTLTVSHSQTISNLTPNTTYNYRIITKDSSNNTATSQNYTFTTQSIPDTTAPTTITDLAISNISQTSLTLSWTVPSDTSGIQSYDIRYNTSPITDSNFSTSTEVSNIPVPAISGTTQTQYISVGLTPSTTYYFAIKSRDSLSNQSNLSNTPQATTESAPSTQSQTPSTDPGTVSVVASGGGFIIYQVSDSTPPDTPSNFKANATNAQISLSWTNPQDFIRVKLMRKTDSYSTLNTDGTLIYEGTDQTFTDTNLQNNQTYYYSLYAYDSTPNYSTPAQISATPTESITQIQTTTSTQTTSSTIQEGDLIRGPDKIKVYIINHYGYKRHIFNPEIFNMYGHFKWENIKDVDQQTLDSYQTSDLYRADGDTKVFSLHEIDEAQGKAQKRWFNTSADKFTKLGYNFNQVFIINPKERDFYQEGTPITDDEEPTTTTTLTLPALAKTQDNPQVYFISANKIKKPILNETVFNSYTQNKWQDIKEVSQEQLDQYPTIQGILYQSKVYILDLTNKTKTPVQDEQEFNQKNLDWAKIMTVNETEVGEWKE